VSVERITKANALNLTSSGDAVATGRLFKDNEKGIRRREKEQLEKEQPIERIAIAAVIPTLAVGETPSSTLPVAASDGDIVGSVALQLSRAVPTIATSASVSALTSGVASVSPAAVVNSKFRRAASVYRFGSLDAVEGAASFAPASHPASLTATSLGSSFLPLSNSPKLVVGSRASPMEALHSGNSNCFVPVSLPPPVAVSTPTASVSAIANSPSDRRASSPIPIFRRPQTAASFSFSNSPSLGGESPSYNALSVMGQPLLSTTTKTTPPPEVRVDVLASVFASTPPDHRLIPPTTLNRSVTATPGNLSPQQRTVLGVRDRSASVGEHRPAGLVVLVSPQSIGASAATGSPVSPTTFIATASAGVSVAVFRSEMTSVSSSHTTPTRTNSPGSPATGPAVASPSAAPGKPEPRGYVLFRP
jgi:hypothetical protein